MWLLGSWPWYRLHACITLLDVLCMHLWCCLPLQAVGQLTYIRPYVTDFSPEWLFSSSMALVAGALGLIYVAGAQQQQQQQGQQGQQLQHCQQQQQSRGPTPAL